MSISKDMWFNFIQSILLKETFLIYPKIRVLRALLVKVCSVKHTSENIKWKENTHGHMNFGNGKLSSQFSCGTPESSYAY